MKIRKILLSILFVSLYSPFVYAIDITFLASQGYSPTGGTGFGNGNLVGQPANPGLTKWTGSISPGSDHIRVATFGADQFLHTVNSTATTTPYYKFSPSTTDLGGMFSATSSILSYSFKLRFDDAPTAGTQTSLLRPRIGEDDAGSPLMGFEVLSNGRFNFTDNSGALIAKTSAATDFVATTGVYFTVSGIIDYASGKYTVSVNGVPQKNALGNVWLSFNTGAIKTPNFTLRELSNGTPAFHQLSFTALHLKLGTRLLPLATFSADGFVDNIGVNTHLGQTAGNLAYAPVKYPSALAFLGELGIRHIRENLSPAAAYNRLDSLFNNYGIKTDLISNSSVTGPGAPANYVPILKSYPFIEAIEGRNEVDNPGNFQYTAANGMVYPADNKNLFTYESSKAYQTDLYNAIKGDPLTQNRLVLGPSMGGTYNSRFLAPTAADILSMHSYTDGYMPSASKIDAAKVANGYKAAGSGGPKPMWMTEAGYHTALGFVGRPYPVDTVAQGKYIPRMLADIFNQGLPTFLYELFDNGVSTTDKEQNFGLIGFNRIPKPSFKAVKNLIALLGEATWNPSTKTWDNLPSFSPAPLDFTLTGNTLYLRHTLLQKSNGDFYLLLWNEVPSYDAPNHLPLSPAAVSVKLTFNQTIAQASTYLLNSTTPTATYTQPRSVTLAVPDEIMVLKLTPAGLPAPWTNADIGTTLVAGGATASGSTFTLRGAGSNIGGAADTFHFAYQTLIGNGEITARVMDIAGADAGAKAGLMLRETSSSNSKFAGVFVTQGNGIVALSRNVLGGSAISTFVPGTAPRWLKLKRSGAVVNFYTSVNGTTWNQIGSPVTMSLTNSLMVGLAITSHSSSTLGTAHLDNVSLSVPQVTVNTLVNASSVPLRQGIFEIKRSGSLTLPLTVHYGLSGNAVNGVDYATLGDSVTIAAGAASARVEVLPIVIPNTQGERSVVLTLDSGAYNLDPKIADLISYRAGSDFITGFEGDDGVTFNSQPRSVLERTTAVADSGTYALKWTFNDINESFNNEVRVVFPVAQNWSTVKRISIRFAEDPANPILDAGQPLIFTYSNNGVKVAGSGFVGQFLHTKEIGFRTITINLEDYPRNLVTGLAFYVNGALYAQLPAPALPTTVVPHIWYIDNIKVE